MMKLTKRDKIGVGFACGMMTMVRVMVIAVLGLGVVGCKSTTSATKNRYTTKQLRPFLKEVRSTARVEILALEPYKHWSEEENVPGGREIFQMYPVLGKAVIAGAAEMDLVRQVVRDIDADGQRWDGAVARCFSPRHGIRIADGWRSYDLLICYECARAKIYKGEWLVGEIYFHHGERDARANADVLDGLLKKHGQSPPGGNEASK